ISEARREIARSIAASSIIRDFSARFASSIIREQMLANLWRNFNSIGFDFSDTRLWLMIDIAEWV
ncbi:hypothetical protein OFB63_36435, partial [Escherichia coli]|nr:hypothetical protein [Escherichia coli]